VQFGCMRLVNLAARYVVDLDQTGHAELKVYHPANGLDLLYEQVALGHEFINPGHGILLDDPCFRVHCYPGRLKGQYTLVMPG